MCRPILLAVLLCGLLLRPAVALSTTCSDPNRAGVIARASVVIPNKDETAFIELVRGFEKESGMSLGEVSSSDKGVLFDRLLIFESPDVSVALIVASERGSPIARITLERTCINDALEDWRPYWKKFQDFMDHSKLPLEITSEPEETSD